jgi:ComF family protein
MLTEGSRCVADHRRLVGLLWCRAPLQYRGTGGDLVRRAKFQHDRAAMDYLARRMAETIAAWAAGPGRRAVLVSVPLHPRKRRQRGYDQAAAIAEAVGRRLGLPFVPRALARVRDTLPQGDVRVTSRVENVAAAFAVRRRRRLDGRLVVLVDDVRTSGSTAMECAQVCRRAGARGVALLTAAQA